MEVHRPTVERLLSSWQEAWCTSEGYQVHGRPLPAVGTCGIGGITRKRTPKENLAKHLPGGGVIVWLLPGILSGGPDLSETCSAVCDHCAPPDLSKVYIIDHVEHVQLKPGSGRPCQRKQLLSGLVTSCATRKGTPTKEPGNLVLNTNKTSLDGRQHMNARHRYHTNPIERHE